MNKKQLQDGINEIDLSILDEALNTRPHPFHWRYVLIPLTAIALLTVFLHQLFSAPGESDEPIAIITPQPSVPPHHDPEDLARLTLRFKEYDGSAGPGSDTEYAYFHDLDAFLGELPRYRPEEGSTLPVFANPYYDRVPEDIDPFRGWIDLEPGEYEDILSRTARLFHDTLKPDTFKETEESGLRIFKAAGNLYSYSVCMDQITVTVPTETDEIYEMSPSGSRKLLQDAEPYIPFADFKTYYVSSGLPYVYSPGSSEKEAFVHAYRKGMRLSGQPEKLLFSFDLSYFLEPLENEYPAVTLDAALRIAKEHYGSGFHYDGVELCYKGSLFDPYYVPVYRFYTKAEDPTHSYPGSVTYAVTDIIAIDPEYIAEN